VAVCRHILWDYHAVGAESNGAVLEDICLVFLAGWGDLLNLRRSCGTGTVPATWGAATLPRFSRLLFVERLSQAAIFDWSIREVGEYLVGLRAG